MAPFKNKKLPLPKFYKNLDIKLEQARSLKQTIFYYPIKDSEIDIAMVWCIRNRAGIQVDHYTNDKVYYKFFGYSMEG